MRKRAFAIVLGLMLLVAAAPMASSAQRVPTTGDVLMEAENGPAILVTGGPSINFDQPFSTGKVHLNTSSGTIDFTSNGPANATIAKSNISGSWTNLTSLDVETNDLTVDPASMHQYTVGGQVDRVSVRDSFGLDDGTIDFKYAGASGTTKLTIRNVPASTEIAAVDQNNNVLDVATSDSNGVITFDSMQNSEHSVELQTSDGAPQIDNSSGSPTGTVRYENQTLSIDVSDPDFPDDDVQVDFTLDGSQIDSQNITSNGTVTTDVTNLAEGSHSWEVSATDAYGQTTTSQTFSFEVDHYDPQFADPSPTGALDERPQNLQINVSDADFANDGDEIDVEFYLDGTFEGTDTITSNDTASVSISPPVGGGHDVRVKATDKWGQTKETTYDFDVPDRLYVKNVTSQENVTANVTVRFTQDDTVVEKTTGSDGYVNLTGLPVSTKMEVRAQTDDYYTRQTVIDSIYEQQSVYVLNNTFSSVEVRFRNDDRTGNFPVESSEVLVERVLTVNGSAKWVRVAGGAFGVNGFVEEYEEGTEYRVIVRNDEGDTRELKGFEATVSETIQLKIGSISVGPIGEDGYGWDASYKNASGQSEVTFNFSDPDSDTTDLHVKIYERQNESNVVFEDTYDGPLGNKSLTVNVNNSTEYVVEWDAQRGEGISGKQIVGPTRNVGPPLDDFWKSFIGAALLIIVAGLFGGLRAELGAVVVSLMGGLLWFIGWLPPAVGAGAIILSLAISIIMLKNSTEVVGA